MKATAGMRTAAIGGWCLLVGSAVFAQAQPAHGVLALNYRVGSPVFPAAAYRNIGLAQFRSMVVKDFQAAGFGLVAVDARANRSTVLRFEFNGDPTLGFMPQVSVSADELLDDRNRCNPCFLRFAEIKNAPALNALRWMAQYDLNALLVPAIDKAYAALEASGREYLDPAFGFNYKQQWAGEHNLFGNSFVGIGLPSLKQSVVRAYQSAGFIAVEGAASSAGSDVDMAFTFPVNPPSEAGALYTVRIRSQFDSAGECHPCEVAEHYDPYQQLPAAGLSGILGRATLESRFTTARDAAHESVRLALGRYLRPRSGYSVPLKPAALGSPSPSRMPPGAVT